MYKLYKSIHEGYEPKSWDRGCEWYITDEWGKQLFWRKSWEEENLYYRHEGYDRWVNKENFEFVRNMSENEHFLIRNKVSQWDVACQCGHGRNYHEKGSCGIVVGGSKENGAIRCSCNQFKEYKGLYQTHLNREAKKESKRKEISSNPIMSLEL